jgi:hypothetical protein
MQTPERRKVAAQRENKTAQLSVAVGFMARAF